MPTYEEALTIFQDEINYTSQRLFAEYEAAYNQGLQDGRNGTGYDSPLERTARVIRVETTDLASRIIDGTGFPELFDGTGFPELFDLSADTPGRNTPITNNVSEDANPEQPAKRRRINEDGPEQELDTPTIRSTRRIDGHFNPRQLFVRDDHRDIRDRLYDAAEFATNGTN